MRWYFEALKKYTIFDGRARRKEFWIFTLFNYMIIYSFIFLGSYVLDIINNFGPDWEWLGIAICIVWVIYVLFSVVPKYAVTWRRLHDVGKSGGWYFIRFIPVIGIVWLIVLLCSPGTIGSNLYGEDPILSTE